MQNQGGLLEDVSAVLSAPFAGTALERIEKPVPVVDVEIAERNIRRWQQHCDKLGIACRPHIKTYKLALFARRQILAGAVGVTCQKLGEAEAMADAGISDILLSYNILGPAKLARLVALARRLRVRVVADSTAVIVGLYRVMKAAGLQLDVLVECDTGGHRCGARSPEDAVELARCTSNSASLRFAGWMTYQRPGGRLLSDAFFRAATARCEAEGLQVGTVSTGGTPDMWTIHGLETVTEYRAGTYVYNDRSRVERGL